jgi:phosphate transport system protein
MTEEARRTFHQQLDEIRDEIVRLAGMAVEAIPYGTDVLLAADLMGADGLISRHPELDRRCLAAEERCYQLLATQSPVARDLRKIMTVVRMTAEVERSHGLVVNIAKAARRIYGSPLDPKLRGLITRMSEHAHQLMKFAVDAFVESDAPLAAALDDMDDMLDLLHADFITTIFEVHATGSLELRVAVQLAMIGRFYERIGDHAVNIGQRVQYMVTGDMPPSGKDGQSGAESARFGQSGSAGF